MDKKLHSLPGLTMERKLLRNNLTPAETALWEVLRKRGCKGKKLRRQHSIGNYIVDFYCPDAKLIIELDGQGHFTESGRQMDSERDSRLAELGFKVLRFENFLVISQLDAVIAEINLHL